MDNPPKYIDGTTTTTLIMLLSDDPTYQQSRYTLHDAAYS
jgi:hypothetical protein